MHSATFVALLAALPSTFACLAYTGGLPKHTGTKSLSAPQYIKKGTTFDAKWVKYDRGNGACNNQNEGGEKDTVFVLEDGATLRNVVIGKHQAEGIYCKGYYVIRPLTEPIHTICLMQPVQTLSPIAASLTQLTGSCNLEYVWFEDVCEDAISLKGDGTANIIGGGAYHASDKIIQHNGCGTVNIVNFYAEDYGKVYRSCGNCKGNSKCSRKVNMSGVIAKNGGELIGINTNLGDKATYSNNCFDTKTQCQGYKGCDKANGECEPSKASAC